MTKNYITVNDLQNWIDHLTDEEKELPIIASEQAFPDETEYLSFSSVAHLTNPNFNGFCFLVRKNYEAIVKKEVENNGFGKDF